VPPTHRWFKQEEPPVQGLPSSQVAPFGRPVHWPQTTVIRPVKHPPGMKQ
jgi:hypothetical protein